MGVGSSGNGRRQDYTHVPLPRMTNTFMLAGQDDPEEILKSVDNGLYAEAKAAAPRERAQVDLRYASFLAKNGRDADARLIREGVTRYAADTPEGDEATVLLR